MLARVVAQVEHERLERLARGSLRSVQPHHRPRELLGGALGEAVQLDVPGARRLVTSKPRLESEALVRLDAPRCVAPSLSRGRRRASGPAGHVHDAS